MYDLRTEDGTRWICGVFTTLELYMWYGLQPDKATMFLIDGNIDDAIIELKKKNFGDDSKIYEYASEMANWLDKNIPPLALDVDKWKAHRGLSGIEKNDKMSFKLSQNYNWLCGKRQATIG